MAERETPPPKKDVARALLLRGSVFVYLDPRAERVRVPPWLAQQAQLVLQIGLDLPVPIPDLRVDDGGVYGTLSFNRAPYSCAVPWEAVFALVGDDGMGVVWAEDMPAEIAAEVEQAERRGRSPLGPAGASAQAKAEKSEKPEKRRQGPRLRAIAGGAVESGEMPAREASSGEDDEGKTKPSHLRVIK